MQDKLLTSVSSLKNWSDKILKETGTKRWTLGNFKDVFDISTFRQFYVELIPFLAEPGKSDNEFLVKFFNDYQKNLKKLDEAMKEYFLAGLVTRYILSPGAGWGRSAKDLVEAIKDIRSNTENIETCLRIEQARE